MVHVFIVYHLMILVARYLKDLQDLFDARPSPRTQTLIASAVQLAERIMRKIER